MTRKRLFEWVKEEYDTDPDYPWQDWNAVLRHKNSRKWYGLVMEIERSKLGLPGNGLIDALNVKCDPRIIGSQELSVHYWASPDTSGLTT